MVSVSLLSMGNSDKMTIGKTHPTLKEMMFRMKQEPLVWKHFDQLVLHDLDNAKNAKQKRQIIKSALGLEKRDWNNKGTRT